MFTSTPVCWVFQRSRFAFDASLSVDTHDSASELFSFASLILLAVLSAVYALLLAVYVFLKFWFVDKLVSERSEFSPKNVRLRSWYDGGGANGKNFVWNIWCILYKQRRNCCYYCSCLDILFREYFKPLMISSETNHHFKIRFQKKQPKIENTFSIFWMILLFAENYSAL